MPSATGSGAIPPRNQANGHGKTLGVDPFRDGNSRKTDSTVQKYYKRAPNSSWLIEFVRTTVALWLRLQCCFACKVS